MAAIWFAMLTAESPGLALQVLTSITTLFRVAKARPQAQPEAFAFCCVAMVLKVPFALDIGPTVHSDPDCVWVYCRQAGHCWAEAVKKSPAILAEENNTTACSTKCVKLSPSCKV